MPYTKEDAIKIVVTCAKVFQDELRERNLLFVCMDKHKKLSYFEVSFHDYSFMHLTGLRPSTRDNDDTTVEDNASDFFSRCLAHKLSPDDFEFSDIGTTTLKLDILPYVICKNLKANMVGDFSSLRPKLYTEKLVGGTKACVGFVYDEKSREYVPNTALKEDIRENVKDSVRVIATYRKKINASTYSEIVYVAKKIDWSEITFTDKYSNLPKPVQYGVD